MTREPSWKIEIAYTDSPKVYYEFFVDRDKASSRARKLLKRKDVKSAGVRMR